MGKQQHTFHGRFDEVTPALQQVRATTGRNHPVSSQYQGWDGWTATDDPAVAEALAAELDARGVAYRLDRGQRED